MKKILLFTEIVSFDFMFYKNRKLNFLPLSQVISVKINWLLFPIDVYIRNNVIFVFYLFYKRIIISEVWFCYKKLIYWNFLFSVESKSGPHYRSGKLSLVKTSTKIPLIHDRNSTCVSLLKKAKICTEIYCWKFTPSIIRLCI